MLQTILDFFRWASTLPPAAEALITLVDVSIAMFIIVVLWTKAIPIAPVPPTNPCQWPEKKTLGDLTCALNKLSEKNAQLLVEVAAAGQYGLYINDCAAKLGLTRNDVNDRAEHLKTIGLIEILDLTDRNFRLNRDIAAVVAPISPVEFLSSYLKKNPMGQKP